MGFMPGAGAKLAGSVRGAAARVSDAGTAATSKVSGMARHAATRVTEAASTADVAGLARDAATRATGAGAAATKAATKAAGLAGDAAARASGAAAAAVTTAAAGLTDLAAGLDWSAVDPTKYLYAGTRGSSRSMEEAQRVWETIPEQVRMGGPESTADYLAGKDWSHIVAHGEGGSDLASNGVWEDASLNRSRGATDMTAAELEAAQQVAKSEAFRATVAEIADSAVTGGAAAAALAAVLAVTEEALRFQQGEIDEPEMWRVIGLRIGKAGVAGAAVAGLITAVAMVFPALLAVLGWLVMPLAVLGFAVYGKQLLSAGSDWYEFWKSEAPLRPLAIQCWLGELGDKLAAAYAKRSVLLACAGEMGTVVSGVAREGAVKAGEMGTLVAGMARDGGTTAGHLGTVVSGVARDGAALAADAGTTATKAVGTAQEAAAGLMETARESGAGLLGRLGYSRAAGAGDDSPRS